MRYAYSTSLLALVFCGQWLGAQSTPSLGDTVATPRTAESSSSQAAWLTRGDAEMLGAAVALTLAVAPLDHPISNELGEPRWHRNRGVQRTAKTIASLGGDGPFVVSSLLYAVGTIGSLGGDGGARLNTLTEAALHNIEAIALAAGVTGLAKGLTGRALPGVAARHAFSFGRGFHDRNGPYVSFPSGHTAAAFAMAATLSGEVHELDPSLATYFTPLAFAGATSVGMARVVQRVHWLSDLPLAAAIGTWSGHVVQSHVHAQSAAARTVRGLTIAPAPGQRVSIGWSSLAAAGIQ